MTRAARPRLSAPLALGGAEWMARAACRDHDPDLWFPEQGDRGQAAKLICSTCPVRRQCADMGRRESWGIWAGRGKARSGRDEPLPPPTDPITCPGICNGTVFVPRRWDQRYHDQHCGDKSRAALRRARRLAEVVAA